VGLRAHFPQVHLLLAEIFARKNNLATRISEIETYLELDPQAKNADQIPEQLAKLEKLNGSVTTSEKPDHNCVRHWLEPRFRKNFLIACQGAKCNLTKLINASVEFLGLQDGAAPEDGLARFRFRLPHFAEEMQV
jgi:hypothetical protein